MSKLNDFEWFLSAHLYQKVCNQLHLDDFCSGAVRFMAFVALHLQSVPVAWIACSLWYVMGVQMRNYYEKPMDIGVAHFLGGQTSNLRIRWMVDTGSPCKLHRTIDLNYKTIVFEKISKMVHVFLHISHVSIWPYLPAIFRSESSKADSHSMASWNQLRDWMADEMSGRMFFKMLDKICVTDVDWMIYQFLSVLLFVT